MIEISELVNDALTELINLAIGRAAGSLNEMVGHEVSLEVPKINFLATSETTVFLNEQAGRDISLVKQNFGGPITGTSYLVFPEKNSLELVRLLLGDDILVDDIPDLEQEALKEVGNVVLNAFLGSLGNEFNISITSEIPEYEKGTSGGVFSGTSGENKNVTLFIQVNFNLHEQNIKSYLVLLINMPNMITLTKLVEKYIEQAQ